MEAPSLRVGLGLAMLPTKYLNLDRAQYILIPHSFGFADAHCWEYRVITAGTNPTYSVAINRENSDHSSRETAMKRLLPIGLVLLPLFVYIESRHPAPMLDL